MSDDEEDFENVSDDKYLKKETEYNINPPVKANKDSKK